MARPVSADARRLLSSLRGRELRTLTGKANTVLRVEGDVVTVATENSPAGQPVLIAEVQAALDTLLRQGHVNIDPDSVGYRSAFIGAVLLTLPDAQGEGRPARVRLTGNAVSDWPLSPADSIRRTELHERFGGSPRGGISPSRRTANVLIFSDPKTGERHGYMDHWDGQVLHYFGEGQRGDQRLAAGNRAILDHEAAGRTLRVFEGARGVVTYLGAFRLDTHEPYYWALTPESGGGPLRRAVVFKLHPVASPPELRRSMRQLGLRTPYRRASAARTPGDRITVEVDPDIMDRGRKAHADLQNALADYVQGRGAEALSPGPLDPNFDVAWVLDGRLSVAEVKSTTAVNEVQQLRLGLGQVLHYQDILKRQGREAQPVLCVEAEPGDSSWLDLCRAHGVSLVWPQRFDRLERGEAG